MTAAMRTVAVILFLCGMAVATAAGAVEQGLTVKGVRFFSYPGFTRIVFETEAAAPYIVMKAGDGGSIRFSAYGGNLSVTAPHLPAINDGLVRQIELRQDSGRREIVILLAAGAGDVKDFVLHGPDRIAIDVFRTAGSHVSDAGTGRKAVIVLDPGHGGRDAGADTGRGPEKNLDLELALAVRKALVRGGAPFSVLLTREKDTTLSFDERAAAANHAEASVFVSLHTGGGSESHVFILDPDEGRPLEARTGGGRDFAGFDTASEQRRMQWGTQQAEYAAESGILGKCVVRALAGTVNAMPISAPLTALRPVQAPAVLVETGADRDRENTAQALADGILLYVRSKR